MRQPGDREREIAFVLDENITGVLADFERAKSASEVTKLWNPHVAQYGLCLSELDVYRTILRWKANPLPWFNDMIFECLANVTIEYPAA